MTKKERLDSMYANSSYIKISNTCEGFGYKLDRAYLTSWGEPRIGIFPIGRYRPDLYLRTDVDYRLGQTTIVGWEIQTTSYGTLPLKEFDRMLVALQDGYRLAKRLNEIDLTKLEVLPDKFDDDDKA